MADEAGSVDRVMSGRMAGALVVVFLMFTGVFITIPVAPVVIEEVSGRGRDAGLVTALFSGLTVATQLVVPRLLQTRLATNLFGLAMFALGVPALVFVFASDDVASMLAASAARGVGFGAASVLASLLVTTLVAPEQRGRAFGLYGVAATVPGIFAPSAGLYLLDVAGSDPVFWIATSCGIAGGVVAFAVGSVATVRSSPANRVLAALGQPRVRAPFLASVALTVTLGAIVTFAPLELPESGWASATVFFLVVGASRAVVRWLSGAALDRWDPVAALAPGAAIAFFGVLLLAMGNDALGVATAALLYGAGSGLVQNAGYLAMVRRGGTVELGVISTLWNLSIDAGVAIGALGFGFLAEGVSRSAVFWSLPAVLVVGVAIGVREWRAVNR